MRDRLILASLIAALVVTPAGAGSRRACPSPVFDHSVGHADYGRHEYSCGTVRLGSVEVSKDAGLGRIDVHEDLVAALQRDEGIVALVDVSNPRRPRVVGRWGNDAQDSLDGDVVFSDDGRWVFYARQTDQFSEDGLHVLDVSDPANPTRTFYQPQGGASRVAYHRDGNGEWVISLDAVTGLVVSRFVREAGALVPVHVDALPALKVGGPASAGLFVAADDPYFGTPTMYVTTGRTGLQIFDISNPALPVVVDTVEGQGLAEVEVTGGASDRTIYAANEYWFDKGNDPVVEVLRFDGHGDQRFVTREPDDLWRVQGMAVSGQYLYVAYSHAGLVVFDRKGRVVAGDHRFGDANEGSRVTLGAPYAFDVEVGPGRIVYVSDAATGTLTILRHG